MPKIANLALAFLGTAVSAGNTEEWKQRSVYQVLTDRFAGGHNGDMHGYLGGTWNAMAEKLDYVKGMGFDAIWISPVVDNVEPGYHGYWARNWEKVNSHFGSEEDLKNLVKTAHSKGIWVMVDVVANHVGPVGNDFSQIYPLNQSYHYHDNCDINWGNQWSVQHCRLAGLPDLNQDNPYVRQYLKDWVKNLVQTYDFDGIRIDTIPEVSGQFWKEYGEASGVFQMGENFNGDPNYVGPYQNDLTALFNYPMYFTIRDVWQHGQSMWGIHNRYAQEGSAFRDVSALGMFVDNHDNARFLNGNGDHTVFKAALAFALLAEGVPFTYYGSEQGFAGGNDPNNREPLWNNFDTSSDIYQFLGKVNAARKAVQPWNGTQYEKYVENDFYAFSRGPMLAAFTNQSNNDVQYTVPNSGFNQGEQVCNVFHPDTDCQTVGSGNSVNVYLSKGEVKIYVPKNLALEAQAMHEEMVQSAKESFLQW